MVRAVEIFNRLLAKLGLALASLLPEQHESPKVWIYVLDYIDNIVLAGDRGHDWVLHTRRTSAYLGHSLGTAIDCRMLF